MTLIELGNKYQFYKKTMHHSNGDEHNSIIDKLSEDLIKELGLTQNTIEIKKALLNMFYLGQLIH